MRREMKIRRKRKRKKNRERCKSALFFEVIKSEKVFSSKVLLTKSFFEIIYIYNCVPFRPDGTPCTLNPSRVRSKGHRPAFPSTCLFRQGFSGWAIEAVISEARSQFVPSRGKNKLTWLLVISTVQVGDTSQDRNSSLTVRLRRLSRTPSSQCHRAPHLCGSPGREGESQENGLMSTVS